MQHHQRRSVAARQDFEAQPLHLALLGLPIRGCRGSQRHSFEFRTMEPVPYNGLSKPYLERPVPVKPSEDATGGVRAVERALALLFRIAEQPRGVGLQQLARDTGCSKSTVHRLL